MVTKVKVVQCVSKVFDYYAIVIPMHKNAIYIVHTSDLNLFMDEQEIERLGLDGEVDIILRGDEYEKIKTYAVEQTNIIF